jgi:hypothetical protein
MDKQGAFKHTSALQFLPSWYANSQSTVGITALVRLGHLVNALDLLDVPPAHEVPTDHFLHSVPQETWMLIASHLFSLSDFITLASVSPLARGAVNAQLKYPHIKGNRLSGVKSTIIQDNDTREKDARLEDEDNEGVTRFSGRQSSK